MGKFLHSSLKAHYIFPIHGLAVVVKKNSTIRGFATQGGKSHPYFSSVRDWHIPPLLVKWSKETFCQLSENHFF